MAKSEAMIAGDFVPGFPLRLAFKDTARALDAAREHGVELPLTVALEGRWNGAIARGHGEDDLAAVITVANRRNGSAG